MVSVSNSRTIHTSHHEQREKVTAAENLAASLDSSSHLSRDIGLCQLKNIVITIENPGITNIARRLLQAA